MLNFLRQIIPEQSPLRLFYHKMMATAAATFYRFPASEMAVIAVTGTNGKTTTCNIIHHIFMQSGQKTGLLTTVNFKVGEASEVNLNKQTTVSPWLLQRKLREMADAGCQVVVVEATSHAMVQSRLWGINVDTAVFTNLTNDHVNYHGSFDAYKEAKGRLFAGLNASNRKPDLQKIGVVNQDDPSAEYFNAFPVDQLFQYGIQKGNYAARNLEERPDGTKFLLRIPNGEVEVDFNIPGRVNVYNALAAATVAVAHHINLQTIKAALENMPQVPGRMEIIDEGQDYSIVVDYAHAEDSLEQLLAMFKGLASGRLILVFGATGGGRDKTKRPKMGAVAHKYADVIVVTDDDPYEEDENEIAAMIREGIPREEGEGLWQVLDRREAVRLGLEMAKPGDVVVIAGKGGEEVQVIGKEKIPYDDRQVVREILARDVDVNLPG